MAVSNNIGVLVLGASGMLGHKVCQVLSERYEVTGTIRGRENVLKLRHPFMEPVKLIENVDITDGDNLMAFLCAMAPEVVINCVGIVDKKFCEANRNETYKVNTLFPIALQDMCRKVGSRLIHISTDCVFNGEVGNYKESSLAVAEDAYGKSKHMGEVTDDNTLTIRTSFIGMELERTRGLLEWFISNRGGVVPGWRNAIFSGFPTVTFARILRDVIIPHNELYGLYHIASEPISKYTLLNLINNAFNLGTSIVEDTDVTCDRSLDGSLFNQRTGFTPAPWAVMIAELTLDAKQYQRVATI